MNNQPVIVEEIVDAPIERVWLAITNKEKMKKWYFDLDAFKPEVGFQFKFKGQGHKGEQYIHVCKVTEVIPQEKIQYSWRYENHPGYSLVTFELFREGNKTRVRLTHAGLETFPQDKSDFGRDSFATGWKEIISSLLPKYLRDNS